MLKRVVVKVVAPGARLVTSRLRAWVVRNGLLIEKDGFRAPDEKVGWPSYSDSVRTYLASK